MGKRSDRFDFESNRFSESGTICAGLDCVRPSGYISAAAKLSTRFLHFAHARGQSDVYPRWCVQHGRPEDSDALYRELDLRI